MRAAAVEDGQHEALEPPAVEVGGGVERDAAVVLRPRSVQRAAAAVPVVAPGVQQQPGAVRVDEIAVRVVPRDAGPDRCRRRGSRRADRGQHQRHGRQEHWPPRS